MLLSMDQCSNVLMDLGDTNKKKRPFLPSWVDSLGGEFRCACKRVSKARKKHFAVCRAPSLDSFVIKAVKIEIQVWFQLFSDNRIQ